MACLKKKYYLYLYNKLSNLYIIYVRLIEYSIFKNINYILKTKIQKMYIKIYEEIIYKEIYKKYINITQ